MLVHADEACLGNGRAGASPGGAGGLVEVWRADGVARRDYFYAEPDTTNNRMAIRSAILALELLGARGKRLAVEFVSDSEYLVKGVNEWLPMWERRRWKNVKNVELWKSLQDALRRHDVTFRWVRGHNLDPRNEYADQLAVSAARTQQSSDGLVESGFLQWLEGQRTRGRYAEFDPDRPLTGRRA